MIPLGVRIAAFLSVPMVAATSASAEEKKKGAPPQSRQSSVMFAIDLPAQPVDATHALKSLCWGFKLQGLTWPFVELTRHFIQIGLRVHRQVSALRKVLS